MLEPYTEHGLFSLAELNNLRLEAMHLFEQCLTSGDTSPLVTFIESQLVHEPPRIQLLRDLADDLQQRLLSLKEYHFDVRDRVIRTFSDQYGVDLTTVMPPDALSRYHQLTADAVLDYARSRVSISDADLVLLRKLVDASLHMAAQLNNDVMLTTQLHTLVLDWMEGMNATIARRYWTSYKGGPQINFDH
jgi:hypothetical protein